MPVYASDGSFNVSASGGSFAVTASGGSFTVTGKNTTMTDRSGNASANAATVTVPSGVQRLEFYNFSAGAMILSWNGLKTAATTPGAIQIAAGGSYVVNTPVSGTLSVSTAGATDPFTCYTWA